MTATATSIPTPSPAEGGFWNSISDMLFSSVITDARLSLDVPDEETWIPSDQTIHWGKRPNYIYPTVKVDKKNEIPAIPRGTKLCARLWFCDWSWDEVDKSVLTTAEQQEEYQSHLKQRLDPSQSSCLDDEKVMIPFEKGVAAFRHLRISKSIKLKKAETFSINSIGFEVGYHNPFNKTSFTTLEIFLSKPVRIHIVAHKGSVKLMQKHGLLPLSVNEQKPAPPSLPPTAPLNIHSTIPNDCPPVIPPHQIPAGGMSSHSVPTTPVPTPVSTLSALQTLQSNLLNGSLNPASGISGLSNTLSSVTSPIPSSVTSLNPIPRANNQDLQLLGSNLDTFFNDATEIVAPMKRKMEQSSAIVNDVVEAHKKLKIAQLVEIVNELSTVQQGIDALKRKIGDFIQTPTNVTSKTYTKVITRADRTINPFLFTFYAFRTHNLELGLSLIKTYAFDVNAKNNAGHTLLHISARHGFVEGVKWCLSHGANVNSQNDNKNTPLHLAYLRSDKTIRKLLKEGNADKQATNYKGLKPRDYRNNRKPLIRTIPVAACSVEIVIEGLNKPFFLEIWSAARFGWLEVVKLYLEQLCCDIDIKTTNGQTPLMCAVEHRREEVSRYLLTMGADVNARDVYDFTALHYAYTSNSPKIIDMLENQFHADVNLRDIFGRTASWYSTSNNY